MNDLPIVVEPVDVQYNDGKITNHCGGSEPIEAKNMNDLPIVVEPIEATSMNDLPIVVEPIEATSMNDLPIVVKPIEAKSINDLAIVVEPVDVKYNDGKSQIKCGLLTMEKSFKVLL